MRRTLVAAIAVMVLASLTVAGIASAKSAGKTITVNLAGITFNGKANNTAKAKVGDKLKFVWKNGAHNVALERRAEGRQEGQLGRASRRSARRSWWRSRRRAPTPSTACRTRRSA